MPTDVNDGSFVSDVIQASHEVPVLVDFWAEWCGPCRQVGPVVEALEQDAAYQGRFRLAKVNTEQSPRVAAQFGISSIPAFKLFYKGQVVDEFVGALPEHALRRFLDSALPDPALAGVSNMAQIDPAGAALELAAAKATGPDAEAILWGGVLALLNQADDASEKNGVDFSEQLRRVLTALPDLGSQYSEARQGLLKLLDSADDSGAAVFSELGKLLRDEAGAREILGRWIDAVADAPGDQRDAPRSRVLLGFQLLGNAGPLVNEYRRKLAAVIF